eukprot:3722696-Prymnesium_polylepis.1
MPSRVLPSGARAAPIDLWALHSWSVNPLVRLGCAGGSLGVSPASPHKIEVRRSDGVTNAQHRERDTIRL